MGILWQCTEAEYHADFSRDCNSSLRLFRQSIPRYAAERVFRTLPPPAQTPEQELGSLFHLLILQPDLFSRQVALRGKIDRRTNAGKQEAADWVAANAGKTPLTPEAYDLLLAMREGLFANELARAAIESIGLTEQAIVWNHLGTAMRARLDAVTQNQIVDLKTTRDISPRGFGRAVAEWEYHCQAALYFEGAEAAGIIDSHAGFVFIAVSKTAPHETVLYQLDAQTLREGGRLNHQTRLELARRKKTANWGSAWSGIQTIGQEEGKCSNI